MSETDVFKMVNAFSPEEGEILSIVREGRLLGKPEDVFQPIWVKLVENQIIEKQFEHCRQEWKRKRVDPPDPSIKYMFAVEKKTDLDKICRNGCRDRREKRTHTLGDNRKGFVVWRHADVVLECAKRLNFNAPIHMVIYKAMLGRKKFMLCNQTKSAECRQGVHSHLSAIPASRGCSFQQNIANSQVYFYELDDLGIALPPRHIMPYAVVAYAYKTSLDIPSSVSNNPPSQMKILVPKRSVSYHPRVSGFNKSHSCKVSRQRSASRSPIHKRQRSSLEKAERPRSGNGSRSRSDADHGNKVSKLRSPFHSTHGRFLGKSERSTSGSRSHSDIDTSHCHTVSKSRSGSRSPFIGRLKNLPQKDENRGSRSRSTSTSSSRRDSSSSKSRHSLHEKQSEEKSKSTHLYSNIDAHQMADNMGKSRKRRSTELASQIAPHAKKTKTINITFKTTEDVAMKLDARTVMKIAPKKDDKRVVNMNKKNVTPKNEKGVEDSFQMTSLPNIKTCEKSNEPIVPVQQSPSKRTPKTIKKEKEKQDAPVTSKCNAKTTIRTPRKLKATQLKPCAKMAEETQKKLKMVGKALLSSHAKIKKERIQQANTLTVGEKKPSVSKTARINKKVKPTEDVQQSVKKSVKTKKKRKKKKTSKSQMPYTLYPVDITGWKKTENKSTSIDPDVMEEAELREATVKKIPVPSTRTRKGQILDVSTIALDGEIDKSMTIHKLANTFPIIPFDKMHDVYDEIMKMYPSISMNRCSLSDRFGAIDTIDISSRPDEAGEMETDEVSPFIKDAASNNAAIDDVSSQERFSESAEELHQIASNVEAVSEYKRVLTPAGPVHQLPSVADKTPPGNGTGDNYKSEDMRLSIWDETPKIESLVIRKDHSDKDFCDNYEIQDRVPNSRTSCTGDLYDPEFPSQDLDKAYVIPVVCNQRKAPVDRGYVVNGEGIGGLSCGPLNMGLTNYGMKLPNDLSDGDSISNLDISCPSKTKILSTNPERREPKSIQNVAQDCRLIASNFSTLTERPKLGPVPQTASYRADGKAMVIASSKEKTPQKIVSVDSKVADYCEQSAIGIHPKKLLEMKTTHGRLNMAPTQADTLATVLMKLPHDLSHGDSISHLVKSDASKTGMCLESSYIPNSVKDSTLMDKRFVPPTAPLPSLSKTDSTNMAPTQSDTLAKALMKLPHDLSHLVKSDASKESSYIQNSVKDSTMIDKRLVPLSSLSQTNNTIFEKTVKQETKTVSGWTRNFISVESKVSVPTGMTEVQVEKIRKTRPETAGKFHGRTLLFGKEVPARYIPLEALYKSKPIRPSGKAEIIPVDPRSKDAIRKCEHLQEIHLGNVLKKDQEDAWAMLEKMLQSAKEKSKPKESQGGDKEEVVMLDNKLQSAKEKSKPKESQGGDKEEWVMLNNKLQSAKKKSKPKESKGGDKEEWVMLDNMLQSAKEKSKPKESKGGDEEEWVMLDNILQSAKEKSKPKESKGGNKSARGRQSQPSTKLSTAAKQIPNDPTKVEHQFTTPHPLPAPPEKPSKKICLRHILQKNNKPEIKLPNVYTSRISPTLADMCHTPNKPTDLRLMLNQTKNRKDLTPMKHKMALNLVPILYEDINPPTVHEDESKTSLNNDDQEVMDILQHGTVSRFPGELSGNQDSFMEVKTIKRYREGRNPSPEFTPIRPSSRNSDRSRGTNSTSPFSINSDDSSVSSRYSSKSYSPPRKRPRQAGWGRGDAEDGRITDKRDYRYRRQYSSCDNKDASSRGGALISYGDLDPCPSLEPSDGGRSQSPRRYTSTMAWTPAVENRPRPQPKPQGWAPEKKKVVIRSHNPVLRGTGDNSRVTRYDRKRMSCSETMHEPTKTWYKSASTPADRQLDRFSPKYTHGPPSSISPNKWY